MTTSSPLDDLKAALSSVARAVTRDPEVEVGFTADAPAQIGKAIKVPTPSRTLPRDQVADRGRLARHQAVEQARQGAAARFLAVELRELPLSREEPERIVQSSLDARRHVVIARARLDADPRGDR